MNSKEPFEEQPSVVFGKFLDHLHYYSGFLVLGACLYMIYYGIMEDDTFIAIIGGSLLLGLSPYWIIIFTSEIKVVDGIGQLKALSKTYYFWYHVLIIINVFIWFSVTLNTLLPFYTIILILLIIYIVLIVSFKLFKKSRKLHFIKTIIMLPLTIVQLFFCINYTFSTNPKTEEYHFHNYSEYVPRIGLHGGGVRTTTLLLLDNDAYSNFVWLRFFIDLEKINGDKIRYTFEDGLFNIRVAKKYEFIN